MTDLPFTINGVDFRAYVEKGVYNTDLIPVIGSKWTDLSKVDHTTIARFKGYLEVNLNPMSPAQVEALYDQLILAPVTVTYFNFKRNAQVTETMMPSWEPLKDAMKRSSGHWVQSCTIEFTEE